MTGRGTRPTTRKRTRQEEVRRGAEVRLAQRYALERMIGSGGMGVVWAAEDEVLGRRVAIKMLPASSAASDRAVRRFEREARAAAGLSDPRIAAVYDFGTDDGVPFLVMELVEGETLAERLGRSRLPPAEAAEVAAWVADALDAAHRAGIVHRDVKPSNVMLTRDGGIKVMDFGIAASPGGSDPTVTTRGFGTPAYLSPEQARGEPATPKSDVYALGAVLYEMVAGRPPFVRPSPVATAVAHVHERPVPLRELVPEVPESLAAVCEAALAKDPDARPGSAALAASLREPTQRLPDLPEATAELPTTATQTAPIPPVPAPTELERSPRRPAGPRPYAVAALVIAGSLAIWILLAMVFDAVRPAGTKADAPARNSPPPSIAVSVPSPTPAGGEHGRPDGNQGPGTSQGHGNHGSNGKHRGED